MPTIEPGGVTPEPTVDLTGVENKLNDIRIVLSQMANQSKPSEKTLIRDLAMQLYANNNFDMNKQSPTQIAKDSIFRAKAFVKQIVKQELI